MYFQIFRSMPANYADEPLQKKKNLKKLYAECGRICEKKIIHLINEILSVRINHTYIQI